MIPYSGLKIQGSASRVRVEALGLRILGPGLGLRVEGRGSVLRALMSEHSRHQQQFRVEGFRV